jgi:hypothetical protein
MPRGRFVARPLRKRGRRERLDRRVCLRAVAVHRRLFCGAIRKAILAQEHPSVCDSRDSLSQVTFAGVFLKNVEIICPNHPGGDGRPMRGSFTISREQENAMREEARKVTDFFFAASNGGLPVDFIFQVPPATA